MKSLKGAAIILTHSRSTLLEELFISIVNQIDLSDLSLIVVRQHGSEEVDAVLKKWKDKINVLIETDGSGNTVAENISRNRLAGYAVAFESLGVDWALTVEDDVLLGADAFQFSRFIMEKYFFNRKFRGINLGSKLPKTEVGEKTYCKTRFGIYGQASALPVTTWNRMKKLNILKQARSGHWDAAMEFYMKTGFSIAPNNSRYLDRGWGGTHLTSDQSDPYFKYLEKSFVNISSTHTKKYFEKDLGYFWRNDLRQYKVLENPMFWIRFKITSPNFLNFYRKIRSIFN